MAKKTGKKDNKDTGDEVKRLYRSREDKVVAGVCGGIGEYFNVDPVWIRIAFVLLIFAQGVGLILYVIAFLLMPENPHQTSKKSTQFEATLSGFTKGKSKHTGAYIMGAILIIIGAIFLLQNLFSWFSFAYVWPLILIAIGIFMLQQRRSK